VSKSEAKIYNASDLASANLLYQNSSTGKTAIPESNADLQISAYPNPVTYGSFSLLFKNVPNSDYLVELLDMNGRKILAMTLNAVSGRPEKIYLPAQINPGEFVLRVINMKEKNKIYTDKIIVAK